MCVNQAGLSPDSERRALNQDVLVLACVPWTNHRVPRNDGRRISSYSGNIDGALRGKTNAAPFPYPRVLKLAIAIRPAYALYTVVLLSHTRSGAQGILVTSN